MRTSPLHPVGVLVVAAMLGPCAAAVATPLPPGSHTEKWIDLRAGECVADLPPADGSRVDVTVVDCATAHLAEVYLRAPMAVDTATAAVANKDCAAGLAPIPGNPLTPADFRSPI